MAIITRYVDPDATGSGDGVSWANAYTSMNLWEAAEQTNLVSDGDSHIVYCRSSSATDDTVPLIIAGWTTDVTHTLTIIGDGSTGLWDESRYVLSCSSYPIRVGTLYTTIISMQIRNTTSGSAILLDLANSFFDMDKCFVQTALYGVGVNAHGCTINLRNSIIVNTVGNTGAGIIQNLTSPGVTVSNCLIYNFYYGIYGNAVTVKNCVSFVNHNDFILCPSISYCASDDNTGTYPRRLDASSGYANEFINIAAYDFRIVLGSVTIGNGTDLSSDFTDTIDGGSRVGAWDIGPFSYYKGYLVSFDDSIGFSDSVSKLVSTDISDLIGFSDDFSKILSVNVFDLLGFSDSISKLVSTDISDAIGFSDLVLKSVRTNFSDSIGFSDLVSLDLSSPVGGSSTIYLKYTSVGTITLALPGALVWSDEMEWSSVVSTVDYSATGALFVQSGKKLKGRNITLTGVPGLTWITRSDLITLNTWKSVLDAEFELTIGTTTYDVMFRNQETAIEVSPIILYNHRDTNALYQINSLKFMEI